jgi:bifunctional DNA-binding transcriptional regulator/antitoxin component of YhaV-PrlF toxin-antitoxin module
VSRGTPQWLDDGRPRTVPLLFMKKVKERLRGRTRISAKNQATLPVAALRRAGLKAGDRVRVESPGPGRLLLVREADPVDHYAGKLTGAYPPRYLDQLRREWR